MHRYRPSFISDLENGKKEVCIRNLEVIASAFDMTISQLMWRVLYGGQLPRQFTMDLQSLVFDECLLSDRPFAIRTPCRLRQDELVSTMLAGDIGENPIERNFGVVGLAVLAGLDPGFRSADCANVNGTEFDPGSQE